MLRVGIMSVSPRMPQWWGASFWAFLRYFVAVDDTSTGLRLHEAVVDLDTHVKKVLSDDWGTGIAIEWLDSRFQYKQVAHGMSAMTELKALGAATFAGPKKQGPQKCPDFLCEDSAGMFHLVECKGNQKGPAASQGQFERGREQKGNVLFTNEKLVSQRLVTGLAIAMPNSNWETTLSVTDPEPKEPQFTITAVEPAVIAAAMKRVTCLQGLLLSGFFEIAAKVFPGRTKPLQEAQVRPVIEFTANGAVWRGQEYKFVFPVPLKTPQGEPIERITLRFGTSPAFAEIAERRSAELVELPALSELDLSLTREDKAEASPESGHPSDRSSIQHGDSFIADLELA